MSTNTALLGLIALALAGCACAQFTAAQVKALPACQNTDVEMFAVKVSQPACATWLQAAMNSPCPADCAEALEAAGEECFAAFIVFQYDYLGVPVSLDVATSYTNSTFYACATGQANTVEAEVALGGAAFANIPSCASADLEAAITSSGNCGTQTLIANLLAGDRCSPACIEAVKAYGQDCLLDQVVAVVEKLRPGGGEAARPQIKSALSTCIGSTRRLLHESSQLGQLELGRAALAALAAANPTLRFF
ncbi:hypothetical protein COHA_007086 [Chlorella ohadii]|uniref:Uncharacterized protein n=1 Tax=Chlorella ohadii TaxID=2649997 RepID=A0AAD5H4M3_9CHLO|nr:hypothetical protein COHA_007086 [Chlorella ohadii]